MNIGTLFQALGSAISSNVTVFTIKVTVLIQINRVVLMATKRYLVTDGDGADGDRWRSTATWYFTGEGQSLLDISLMKIKRYW